MGENSPLLSPFAIFAIQMLSKIIAALERRISRTEFRRLAATGVHPGFFPSFKTGSSGCPPSRTLQQR